MKKLTVTVVSIMLAAALLAGCGGFIDPAKNPMTEYDDAAAMAADTGVDIDAPQGAAEISYSSVDMAKYKIAQVEFGSGDADYTLRCAATAEPIDGVAANSKFTDEQMTLNGTDNNGAIEATVRQTTEGGFLATWTSSDGTLNYSLFSANAASADVFNQVAGQVMLGI